MDITDLLSYTQNSGASDLHISSGNYAIIRVNGDMTPLSNNPPLNAEMIREMLYSIMTDQQRSEYEAEMEIDFSVSFGDTARFRVNAFNTMNGPAAVFRTIPTRVMSLEEIHAPEIFKKIANLSKGLVLVTGPTGSGKSTTLAAIIDYINTHKAEHIITIEDPIEFVHQSKQSLINQREVGANTKSFARALKSCLREDPDIILVGELRDIETVQLAMTAAETGHLVMGTLHTNSAPKTIDRIIDVFPDEGKPTARAMLSVSLEAVIAQTLLKKADGSGRVAAHEIMLATPAVRNLIRENKVPQLASIIQTGSKFGMQAMKDCLDKYLEEGVISEDERSRILATSSEFEDAGNNASQQQMGRASNMNNF